MIKNIGAEELLETPEFVREPVDKLCKKIDNSDAKRIILSGGQGTGKSVVLGALEKKRLGSERQFIYTWSDPTTVLGSKPSEELNEQFWNHFHEMMFSRHILYYIKSNYADIYDNRFKDIELLLDNISKQTHNYINNVRYQSIALDKYLMPMELSSRILEEFKKIFTIESLGLMIDRFDWTNGSNPLSQNILSQYFDLFDQVIITADDESLLERKNRKAIIEKGYSFIDVNYGKNMMAVKSIIRRRIQEHNRNLEDGETRFPEDIMTDEIYQSLITKTNGNIEVMLDSIRELLNHYWFYGESFDIEKHSAKAIDESVKDYQNQKKMDACPPKFYL